METFAFTYVAVDFEDPGPAPSLRSFEDIEIPLPKSAVLGIAGSAAALSVMVAAPDAQAVVRPGDVCPAVETLQSELASRNYSPGGIDGVYGPFTERAVRNFQLNNGLSVDGIAGPATADALGLASPGSPFEFGAGCGAAGGGGGPVEGTATVTASVLNIRSGPSLGSPVVGELFEGTRVEILDTFGGWSQISSNLAGEAWVSSEFLSTGGGTGGDGPITSAVVSASALNVRSGPSLGNPVQFVMSRGEGVDIIRYSGDWAFVEAELGGSGWVDSSFLASGGTVPPSTGGGGAVVSTASGLGANVRAFPNGPVVGGLPDGAVVRLTGITEFAGGVQWSEMTSGNWIATFVLS